MKRFISVGLMLCIVFSNFMTAGYAQAMQAEVESDIQGHWAEDNLRKWSASGVLTGYPDGTLRPNQPITRAEMVVILQRMFAVNGTDPASFSDVPTNAWYAQHLSAALSAGYIKGYVDGTFKPNKQMTRAEAAVVLSRAFQLSETTKGLKSNGIDHFSDKTAIPAYALSAVKELVMAGAIKGLSDGSFGSSQYVTRSEVSAMLDRLAGSFYNKPVIDERKETIRNAVVNTKDIILRNKEITGHLYLTAGVGTGDVTVENTKIDGVTFINGGGQESIHLDHTNAAEVILYNPDHPIRVVVGDHSNIQRLVLRSPAIVQTSDGASIQLIVLQEGFSGTVISGNGAIHQVISETSGITVNDIVLERGMKYVWSPERKALIPVGEKETSEGNESGGVHPGSGSSAPGTGGNVNPQPPNAWSVVASQGSLPGTSKVTASVTAGNRLAILVSNKEITPPSVGTALLKSSLMIDPYESGTDISGVDPDINKYLGVYEVNASGKIVRFQQVALTEANIKPETWKMVWNDEFEGSTIDTTKWNHVRGGGGYGNNELQYYTDRVENARIENGQLVIEAHQEHVQGNAYTSAKLTTEGKGSWTYGKFEIRAKMPQGKGIWPAIWMMPEDSNLYSGWPASGEIDIMELLGHEPSTIHGTLHYGQPHEQSQGSYTLTDGTTFADDYHTFAVEWEPGEFRFYVDGVLYAKQNDWFSKNPQEGGEYTYPAPFDRDFFMQLNLAVGGNWPGNPDQTTLFPQKMLVDYVRVYEREGHNYRQPIVPPTKTEEVRQPNADGNYVENGTFEEGWNHWVFQPFAPPADLFGGTGSVAIDQGAIKTVIEQEGNENYAIQLVQADLPLVKGATYQLSFDAWSSGDRTMVASMAGPDRGYTRYMDDKTVLLTAARSTYTYTFMMNSNTDPNARLEFNMGKAGTLPVWIDEVSLVKVADPDLTAPREALPSGNLIYNGTFDQGKDRLGFWDIEGPGSKDAIYHVGSAIHDRKLYVQPLTAGQPDALLLTQDRIKLLTGKLYILSFTARAADAVNLTVQIGNQDQQEVYANNHFTISTEQQTYSMIFPMDSTASSSKLQFELGALTARLELDQVSLKEMNPPAVVNGSKRIEAEHYSDMSGVQKGEDGLSVGWIDPGDWMQYILDVKRAGEYKISYYVASGYEGGGSLTLLAKQGSVYTHTLPIGEIREEAADRKYTWNVANTGDWGSFKLMEQTIELGEGIQTLQIYAPHVNIDYFTLTDINYRGNTGNLIRNGTFDTDVREWQTYQSDNQSDKLSISAKDGVMQVHLPELMAENWNQQVYQEGLTLEQGRIYTVTFDVYSTVNRPIQLGVGYVDPNHNYAYTDYLNGNKPTIWLTDVKQQQQFSFVMNHPTETNAKLEFDLGQLAIQGTVYDQAGDIFLDNIRLSSSLIQNGLFNDGTDQWSAYWGDEWNGTSKGDVTHRNGNMVIKIDTAGNQNWIPQISQEGFRLEEGKTYQLSFDASASVPRKINIGLGKKLSADPWYIGYYGTDVSLTTDTQRYTYTFTMSHTTEDNARIDFNVGVMDGLGSNTEVTLDNIVLVEMD